VELLNHLRPGNAVVFLVLVLVVSIVAGSPLMVAVSVLLLAVFAGLAYRARVIERNLERDRD
jgi:cell division protein FtsW (lipid II flippase)